SVAGKFPAPRCARGGMADAPDLGSGSERIGGSSPLARTRLDVANFRRFGWSTKEHQSLSNRDSLLKKMRCAPKRTVFDSINSGKKSAYDPATCRNKTFCVKLNRTGEGC